MTKAQELLDMMEVKLKFRPDPSSGHLQAEMPDGTQAVISNDDDGVIAGFRQPDGRSGFKFKKPFKTMADAKKALNTQASKGVTPKDLKKAGLQKD